MIAWWHSREPRERMILALGAAAALAILLFALLGPWFGRLGKAEQRLLSKQEDLRWLEASAPQVMSAGPGIAEPATPDNALVIVDRVARESGLANAVSQVQPTGKGQFQASLREAAFDNVVAWLARLRQQHGIAVVGISVSASSKPGVVNASVQLKVPAR
jgi:general secretion pathway protein M